MPIQRSNGLGVVAGGGVSRTKQSEGPQTDINTIVNRYLRSGELTHYNASVLRYGDFSAVGTLQEQMHAVHEARERFGALPAGIKAAAGHDPLIFLQMLATVEGTEVLIEAGLDAQIQRVDDAGNVLTDDQVEEDAERQRFEAKHGSPDKPKADE